MVPACVPFLWNPSEPAQIAAYYQDALDARHITHSKAAVLVGGIKEWTKLYGESEGGLVVRL